MENVVAFNNELSGLYDTKPPISKAKMASITKSAMRAIKFYKHVVQSVEKFILKCKPEYKIPGLYVIDSIVRQSRHQFGNEKDVFAPRFARNMKETFANLFRCAPEDKSRIIRVLNLWQKNNVFVPEVIQPIFDLADPNHPIYQMSLPSTSNNANMDISSTSNGLNTSIGGSMDINAMQAVTATGGNLGDDKLSVPDLSNNNLKQLLKDPNVLRQLQTLQNFQKFKQQQEEKQNKLNEMRLQEEAFEKHLQNVLKGTGQLGGIVGGGPVIDSVDLSVKEVEFVSEESKIEVINLDGNDSRSPSPAERAAERFVKRRRSRSHSRSRERAIARDRDRRRRSRSRSRGGSRSPRTTNRRRISRERERERDRDRDRGSKNEIRDKEKERDRERERERRRKGLPDSKKEHLSVCSTTLWVGHLSKLVYQEELSDTFGKYGDIVSIDQIIPRGCAFIVMNRRQDANKAMQSLKNYKLQGRAITISWAAGKGVKSKEWKDFWDLELGVTYIPWSKLDDKTDLDSLEEGGMFDEDSMPTWMKEKINKLKSMKEENESTSTGNVVFGMDCIPNIDTTQPPPGPPPGGMMPMVPPQFSMAPPPRLMGPMGVPLPGNMVSNIPMPPNMVAGMPPPHPMMMTGMIPPGFPPIGQMDKNAPPPSMRGDAGGPPNSLAAALGSAPGHFNPGIMPPMSGPPPMGLPLNPNQFQVPPNAGPGIISSDDQMDIEMEDEDHGPAPPQVNFNQPPPMFVGGAFQLTGPQGAAVDVERRDEFAGRDRNRNDRGAGNSRWGGRGVGGGDDFETRDRSGRGGGPEDIIGPDCGAGLDGPPIWHENGGNFPGGPNFNDVRGPINIAPPLDINNPPQQRTDFFEVRDEFNESHRGNGPRGAGPANGLGDFFGNMQNRFGQPTSLMQMRIAPPSSPFNTRMGGPCGPVGPVGPGGPPGGGAPGQMMFMRGQGGPGGPPGLHGGRHQGPGGFNFNDRPPFDRDGRDGGDRMIGGRGRRGIGRGGGPGNWRDEDDEQGGVNFRRQRGGPAVGGGGGGANRFRDRDGLDDRRSRDRDRDRSGGRRIGGDHNSRDRERDRRDNDRNRGGNRRNSRDEPQSLNRFNNKSDKPLPAVIDTEEDWDLELSEHDIENTKPNPPSTEASSAASTDIDSTRRESPYQKTDCSNQYTNNSLTETFSAPPINSNELDTSDRLQQQEGEFQSKIDEQPNYTNTPLYDEAPAAATAPPENNDVEPQNASTLTKTLEEMIAPAPPAAEISTISSNE